MFYGILSPISNANSSFLSSTFVHFTGVNKGDTEFVTLHTGVCTKSLKRYYGSEYFDTYLSERMFG